MTISTSRRRFLAASLAGSAAAAVSTAASAKAAASGKSGKTLEYDVVIVGAGCAGLSAAIEAADRGAKPVILEKCFSPMGNTIYAGGNFNAVCTWVQKRDGVKDSLDSFFHDMVEVSRHRCDMDLMKMYCEESAGVIQWLTDRCGVKWKKLDIQIPPMLGRCHEVTGPIQPGGSQLVDDMMKQLDKLGVPILTSHKVIEVMHDDMLRCTGVKCLTPKGLVTIRAKGGVVMCTGGFSNNKGLITQYMGGAVAWMPLRGSAVTTGENITLLRDFFPQYVNMDQYHAGPIHAETRANPSNMVNFGICVNPQGHRYVDEANTYVYVGQNTPKLVPENRAFIILDSKVRNEPIVDKRFKRYQKAKAPIFQANTIEELAKQCGIPADTLAATVKEYNEACRAGKGSTLKVKATMEKPNIIDKPPFYGFEFSGGLTTTFGGPKINTKAEVLNLDGKAVPGLYAAGNAIGGLFYDNYLDGSQLVAAVIWGRVAAQECAKRAKAA